MLRRGPFVDPDLTSATSASTACRTYVETRLPGAGPPGPTRSTGCARSPPTPRRCSTRVARVCLVHSDLNPKNLLLDPDTLEVTGVLDWEFAHAGHPFTDLGNLLRFDRDPGVVDAVLGAYGTRRGTARSRHATLARAADLWALVDLAARRHGQPGRRAGGPAAASHRPRARSRGARAELSRASELGWRERRSVGCSTA